MAKLIQPVSQSTAEWDASIQDAPKPSDDTDIPPEGLGHDLYKARQLSGKTLMDVWHETKIPPHHLLTIETGRFDALPGRVYAIGFVRSYSAYLGLDAEICVARLRQEMGARNVMQAAAGPLPLPEPKDPEAEFDRSGNAEHMVGLLSPTERNFPGSLIAGLMIAALIFSGYYLLASEQNERPPVIPVPAQLAAEAGRKQVDHPPPATVDQPPPASNTAPVPPIEEIAPSEPEPVLPPATAELTPALPEEHDLAPSTEAVLTPPLPIPRPAHIRRAPTPPTRLALVPSGRSMAQEGALPLRAAIAQTPLPPTELTPAAQDASPTETLAIPSEPRARFHSPLPLGQRYGMENRNSRIILRVHRLIQLDVRGIDNRIFIDRILDAGDTYRVPNLSGLKLSASDAGAIEVILDDTTIGFAGRDGAVAAGISLEPQSIIDHIQHG